VTDDEGPDYPPFGHKELDEWRRRVTSRARLEAKDAISKLWLGNGAGLAASVTALGAPHYEHLHFDKWFITCPISFALGLISLGIGSVAALYREVDWLTRNRDADGVLDVQMSTIRSPEDELGLVPSHPKMALAYVAGVAFVLGVALGIAATYAASLG
jgi:hypothetical protein